MKRILCLLLSLVMTLALCACGAKDNSNNISIPTQTVSKTTTTTQTTTTTVNLPDLVRGNEVGNVCYDADLPIITADGIGEQTIDPTAYGKVTVIHFWGTWSGPSVAEMPYFDAIAKKYDENLKVVAIHGMMASTAPTYIANNHPDSPIVFLKDIGEAENDYYTRMGGNGTYPLTYVLNEKGIITHVFSHAVSQTELETAVLQAMGRM